MAKASKEVMIPDELVINKIYLIREKKVMLDRDLAGLYAVETRRLKEAVRRNIDRFPEDFMFELTQAEFESLRSQIATSKPGRGGARYLHPVGVFLPPTGLWRSSFMLIAAEKNFTCE